MPTSSRIFIDTNVLLYRSDSRDPAKQVRAAEVLAALSTSGTGSVSTQVASEFACVLGRKFAGVVPSQLRRALVADIFADWEVASIDERLIDLALEGQDRFGFAYYDAQIWAAALLGGANTVLSEDFTDGSEALGVRFVNPFAEHFDPDTLTA